MKESLKEKVQDYCDSSVRKNLADGLMKQLRPEIITGFKNKKLKKFAEGDYILEVRESIKKKIDIEALEKICKKKNIAIGEEVILIRPKNGNIPEKVLKDLDKYFILERALEVDVKTIQKAVDNGFINQKDYDKIVSEDSPTISLYPTVTENRKKELENEFPG